MPSAVKVYARLRDLVDFGGGLTDSYVLKYNQALDRFELTPPATGGVTSFNGRTGAVLPSLGDYGFADLFGALALSQIEQGGASNGQVLTWNGTTWAPAAAGSSLPVADSTAIVMGSVDGTKRLRFEVDGFTTGQTRVLTPPNQDGTIALLERAQTFTQPQSVASGSHFITLSGDAGSGPMIRLLRSGELDANITVSNASGFIFNSKLTFSPPASISGITTQQAEMFWSRSAGGGLVRIHNNDVHWTDLSTATNGYLRFLDTSGNQLMSMGQLGGSGGVSHGNVAIGPHTAGSTRLHVMNRTNATTSVTGIITYGHNSTGTPGTGFGARLVCQLESSTTEDRTAFDVTTSWAVATDASRRSLTTLSAYDTAARECLRMEASGSAPMIGFLGAAAALRQPAIADPTGGSTQDVECRAATSAILALLRTFGFLTP